LLINASPELSGSVISPQNTYRSVPQSLKMMIQALPKSWQHMYSYWHAICLVTNISWMPTSKVFSYSFFFEMDYII